MSIVIYYAFDLKIGQILLVRDVLREKKCPQLDVTGHLLAFVHIMGDTGVTRPLFGQLE